MANDKVMMMHKKQEKCFIDSIMHLAKSGDKKRRYGKTILLLEKPNKEKKRNDRFVKIERAIMINMDANIFFVLIKGIVFIGIVIIAIMVAFKSIKALINKICCFFKSKQKNKQKHMEKNRKNVTQVSQIEDDNITKEDADTFLQIIDLLNQLYS